MDFIIQADKDLVSALTSSSPDTAADLLNEISKTIESVIVETRDTIDTSKDPKFTNAVVYDCDDIIKVLGDISNEILDLSDEKIDKPSDRRVNDKIHIAVDDLKKVTFI